MRKEGLAKFISLTSNVILSPPLVGHISLLIHDDLRTIETVDWLIRMLR